MPMPTMPTKPERPVSTIRTSQSVPRPTSYSPPSLWVEMRAATGSARATITPRARPLRRQRRWPAGRANSEATMLSGAVMATTFKYARATEASTKPTSARLLGRRTSIAKARPASRVKSTVNE